MTQPQEPKGQPFERLVAAVQKKLDADAEVEWDAKIVGKSGTRRQVDVAIRGRRGSAKIFLAVEAKDHRHKIGIELVEAFIAKLDDLRAHKGIMVTSLGYTRDALLRARTVDIDTCVLRPANDADWEGHLRSFQITIQPRVLVHEDAEIGLVDGDIVKVVRGIAILKSRAGETYFFDMIVNGWLAANAWEEGQVYTLKLGEPLFRHRDNEMVEVLFFRFRPRYVACPALDLLTRCPEDWVFVQYLPDKTVEEKRFFEFAELERLAEEFRVGVQTKDENDIE